MTLSELILELTIANTQDSKKFQDLLNEGMTLLNLSDEHVARMVGVSRPSVARWRSGSTKPHTVFRRMVYDKLLEYAYLL